MGQRAAEDLPVREPVAGGDLQGVQIRAHMVYGASGRPVWLAPEWQPRRRRVWRALLLERAHALGLRHLSDLHIDIRHGHDFVELRDGVVIFPSSL
jgi:hypothetical protein